MHKLWSLLLAVALFVGHAFATPTGTLTVSAGNIVDSTGTPLVGGTVYFAPVDASGNPISYRINGLGQSLSRPVSAQVVNGVFSIVLPDTSVTAPAHVCFSVTVVDANSGENILGGGYSCVQPTSVVNAWCSGTSCNFDSYPPNLASIAIVQTGPIGPQGIQGNTGPQGVSGAGSNIPLYGIVGAYADGVHDDSAAVATACAAYPEFWLTSSARYLIASNLTLNCNVRSVGGGGFVIPSGVTVTFNGDLYGMVSQMFYGAATGTSPPVGSVIFGSSIKTVKAEWFGAVRGATDSTAQINNALLACANYGCDVELLQGTAYTTSAAIYVPSGVGLVGPPVNDDVNKVYAKILSSSSSADVIDIGPVGNTACCNYNGQRVKNIYLGRSVLPSSGSRGLACNGAVTYDLESLVSTESYSDYWYNGCTSGDTGKGSKYLIAGWGQNGVTGYVTSTVLTGIDLNSENGVAENTIFFHGGSVMGGGFPSNVIVQGISIHGSHINDVNLYDYGFAGASYGLVINYDGAGAQGTAYDIHASHMTFDGCTVTCVKISNIPPNGSVVLTDLYAVANGTSPSVDLETSDAVRIEGAEIANIGSGAGLYLYQSQDNLFNGVEFDFINSVGMSLNSNSSHNTISGRFISANTGSTLLSFADHSMFNNLVSIRGDGQAQYGIYFDATSGLNRLGLVDFWSSTPAAINAPIYDLSVQKQTTGACVVMGVPVLALGSAAGSGATVAFYPDTNTPQHNCNFAVIFTPGTGATAGEIFTASFTLAGNVAGSSPGTIATNYTAGAVMSSSSTCSVSPYKSPIAAASSPYLGDYSAAVAVVSVLNVPTGAAVYLVKCGAY